MSGGEEERVRPTCCNLACYETFDGECLCEGCQPKEDDPAAETDY
jgi:hypothetical protein